MVEDPLRRGEHGVVVEFHAATTAPWLVTRQGARFSDCARGGRRDPQEGLPRRRASEHTGD
jgi:hypothetical protein